MSRAGEAQRLRDARMIVEACNDYALRQAKGAA